MPYITREDGERFVIPAYRDEISAKNNSALRKEIITLSQSYGEYIAMQRKATLKYDIAFSPDAGYLLGESIWHYFKRPMDMIYCEAVPNTTEAILVIVKDGQVYLDGRFPVESIPEELIIFLTQKNQFEISIYGDVPIVREPAEGKFSFDSSSVKSFTELKDPIFPTLPLVKAYQLQLVEPTLKRYGVSGIDIKKVITFLVLIGAGWYAWTLISPMIFAPPPAAVAPQVNPYQGFYDALATPAPDAEIMSLIPVLQDLVTIPGWTLMTATYQQGSINCDMKSEGAQVEDLIKWADARQGKVTITSSGISLSLPIKTTQRAKINKIYPIQQTLAVLLDHLVKVYPGNNVQVAEVASQGAFQSIDTGITLLGVGLAQLELISKQLKDLPFVVKKVQLNYTGTGFSGSIGMTLLGS